MIKTIRVMRKVSKDGKVRTFFSDTIKKAFSTTRKYLSDLVFAVAMSAGVTPKQVAKNLKRDKVNKFGADLSAEVGKEIQKQVTKAEKTIESTGAVVKKRGRPSKKA